MKEATGEVSMTMVTIVAVGVIGAILALFWNPIKLWIQDHFLDAAGSTGVQEEGGLGNVNLGGNNG